MTALRNVKVELITPVRAKELLKHNTKNRNVSERSLNHYIRQLEDGAWEFNGDTIRIGEDGTLFDGQHRLMAIVKTGKPMECIIVSGLKKSAMSTIDTGRIRLVGDHLKILGKVTSYHFALAAACSIIFKFRKGKFIETHERQTAAEAIKFIDDNPKLIEINNRIAHNAMLIRLLTPSIAVACYYLFSNIDKYKTEEFFEKLTTGEKLGATSPVLKLRSQLISSKGSGHRSGRLHQRTYLYYICAAFDAFLHNRRVEGHFKYVQNAIIDLPSKTRTSGR